LWPRASSKITADVAGDALTVPAEASVSSQLGPHTRASVVGPARLALRRTGDATVVALERGTLLADFAGGSNRTLQIDAPGATIEIVGTLFSVEVASSTCTSVAHGRVKVTSTATANVMFVGAGERYCVDAAIEPIAPTVREALERHEATITAQASPPGSQDATIDPRAATSHVSPDVTAPAAQAAGAMPVRVTSDASVAKPIPSGAAPVPVAKPHASVAKSTPSGAAPVPVAKPDASVAKPDASVAKSTTSVAAPDASVAKPGVSKLSASVAKPMPVRVAKPDASIAKSTPVAAKPDASVAKSTPSVSEPGASVAKPAPSVSEPEASVAKTAPSTAKPDALVAKPDAWVAKPDAWVAKHASVAKPDASGAKPVSPVAKSAPATPPALYRTADTALAARDLAAADRALATLVTTHPDSPLVEQALFDRARIAHQRKQWPAARQHLARLTGGLLAEPSHWLRCRIEIDAGANAAARTCLADYRRTFARSPHDLDALALLARLAHASGGCTAAAAAVRALATTYPRTTLAASWRARCPNQPGGAQP
jgi:hypothetical protein